MVFQKLTPTKDINMDVYDEAMQFVFDNEDIRNIAISGSYGAGKSSLLESYKKSHPDKKFLNISLAHFTENDEQEINTGNDIKKTSVEITLEGKLINQLIQQIDEKDIPQTNFKLKKERDLKEIWKMVSAITVFFMAALYIWSYSKIAEWVGTLEDNFLRPVFDWLTGPYSQLVMCIFLVALFARGIYVLVCQQRLEKTFRKISFQGNEIELFSGENNSYFDKYLNEVLYLFEHSGVDAIIFEDIDRFNSVAIFERLREINMLVNIRLEGKVLRFFYLLRDDIFESKDRTKFFDYILPVIPVIDGSNSYNKLREYFTNVGLYEAFDDKFLRRLSLYVDDMRILKNIFNEFIIYFNKLKKISPDANRMLAVLTYKNLFPKDYSDLQQNKGYIYTLFDEKKLFVESDIKRCDEKIKALKEKIKWTKNEHLVNKGELEGAKQWRQSESNRGTGTYEERVKRQNEYEKWLKGEYIARKEALEQEKEEVLKRLDIDLEIVQQEKEIVRKKRLCQLITKSNEHLLKDMKVINEADKEECFLAVKGNDYFKLLIYLIRSGYLDETHRDYMTYFYENSLTVNDKIFLRGVVDRKAYAWDYHLDNIPLLLENLDVLDFEQPETLNYELLSYLVVNESGSENVKRLINQLNKKKGFEFVVGFCKRDDRRTEFVAVLNTYWPSYFGEAIKVGPERHIEKYCIDTLLYSSMEVLKKVDVDKVLSTYVSNHGRDIISENGEWSDKLIAVFAELDILFENLPVMISSQNCSLFDKVYQNNMYKLSLDNVQVLLTTKYQADLKGIETRYISSIFAKPEEWLCLYVEANIVPFLKVVLEDTEVYFTDDSESVVQLLDLFEESCEETKEYIARLQTKVENLVEVCNSQHKGDLLDSGRVKYTEDNIIDAFVEFGLEERVIAFINSDAALLDFGKANIGDSIKFNFWDKCVVCNEIDNAHYSMILTTINRRFEIFNADAYSEISEDKIDILVNEKIIPMNEESLLFMRKVYPGNVSNYIKINLMEYKNLAKGNMADVGEVEEALSWDIEEQTKIELLSEIAEEVAITDMDYSENVVNYIMDHNFAIDDLPFLCQQYDLYSPELQEKIFDLAKVNLKEVYNAANGISLELLYKLLENADSEEEQDILFDTVVDAMINLDNAECQKCLELLDMKEIAKIFDKKKRPNIVVNEYNRIMLDALVKHEFLKGYAEDEEKQTYKVLKGPKCDENVAQ